MGTPAVLNVNLTVEGAFQLPFEAADFCRFSADSRRRRGARMFRFGESCSVADTRHWIWKVTAAVCFMPPEIPVTVTRIVLWGTYLFFVSYVDMPDAAMDTIALISVFSCEAAWGVAFHVMNAVVMGLNSFFWSFAATYPAVIFCAIGPGYGLAITPLR